MNRLSGNTYIYISVNLVDLTEEQPQLYLPEFLRSLKILKFSSSELKLKIEMPIILL